MHPDLPDAWRLPLACAVAATLLILAAWRTRPEARRRRRYRRIPRTPDRGP